MKCSDIQSNLSLFVDQNLDGDEKAGQLQAHLSACPLCRERFADYRAVRSGLQQLKRPEISLALQNTIKDAVRNETWMAKRSWVPVSSEIRNWFQMQVMPLGVGVFGSLLIGLTFLSMMFSGMLSTSPTAPGSGRQTDSILLASNTTSGGNQDTAQISPSDFANSRLGLANESPSINPRGALVALTRSLVRGGMKDDEVVVVADVFSNGLAQIAEVVEPSRDTRAVGELEKALESDPEYAPFIPSNIESRPSSVRVVLKFQSVNVSTRRHGQR